MKIETLTEVKERPILFSTPMVRAILEGRKTVTRRVIKPQPVLCNHECYVDYGGNGMKCPYGKPGDVLWVRETWAPFNGDCGIGCEYGCHCPTYIYKADYDDTEVIWKPSIHMPRAACRLSLEIVSITVERLQDISEEDAIREGIEVHVPVPGDGEPNVKLQFKNLWTSINGPESWNANPWCWRIEFKRIQLTK